MGSVALRSAVSPTPSVVLSILSVMLFGAASTLIFTIPFMPDGVLMRMLALPAATAFTVPSALTLATFALEEAYVMLSSEVAPSGAKCQPAMERVSPTPSVISVSAGTIPVGGTAFTAAADTSPGVRVVISEAGAGQTGAEDRLQLWSAAISSSQSAKCLRGVRAASSA